MEDKLWGGLALGLGDLEGDIVGVPPPPPPPPPPLLTLGEVEWDTDTLLDLEAALLREEEGVG